MVSARSAARSKPRARANASSSSSSMFQEHGGFDGVGRPYQTIHRTYPGTPHPLSSPRIPTHCVTLQRAISGPSTCKSSVTYEPRAVSVCVHASRALRHAACRSTRQADRGCMMPVRVHLATRVLPDDNTATHPWCSSTALASMWWCHTRWPRRTESRGWAGQTTP
jgi:hypothetical protein